MPSFSVDNENYYYYFEHYTGEAEFDGREIVCSCIKYTFIIIISFPLLLFWYFISIYLLTHNSLIYYKYYIYWLPNIIYSLLCSIWIILLIYFLRNIHESDNTLHYLLTPTTISQKHRNYTQKMRKKCLILTIILMILIIIPCILIEIYTNNYIFDLYSPINSKYFTYNWNWFELCVFVGINGFLPIIYFGIWYCILIKRKYTNEAEQGMELILSNKHKSTNYTDRDDMNQHLLIESDQDSLIDRQAKPLRQSISFLIIYFGILFWYFLETKIWSFHIINSENNYNKKNYNLLNYYLQFLILYSIFKWIAKYYGNLIDRIRSLRNNNQHYLSMEFLMEWYFSVLYWVWLRWFTMFKINTTSGDNYQLQFIYIIIFHILSEMSQTNLKITNLYYSVSSMCINWLFHHRMQNNFNFWLYSSVRDGSDKKVWRNRICIDLMVRFYASIISGVVALCLLFVMGKQYYNHWFDGYVNIIDGNKENIYVDAIIWLSVSVGIDFAYYMITFYAILLTKEYLVCEAMIKYMYPMTSKHLLILLLIYFLQYSFYLFL